MCPNVPSYAPTDGSSRDVVKAKSAVKMKVTWLCTGSSAGVRAVYQGVCCLLVVNEVVPTPLVRTCSLAENQVLKLTDCTR